MTRTVTHRQGAAPADLPRWIRPQLTQLVDQAPEGDQWLHEIKYDGYRMHARLDLGAVKLLTRTGLDWTHKYPAIAAAVGSLPARQAYLDGAMRRRPRRHHVLQHDPAGVRKRQRGGAGVLRVRSSLSRRRRSLPTAAL
jgi:ATP-dependent DNA ligase